MSNSGERGHLEGDHQSEFGDDMFAGPAVAGAMGPAAAVSPVPSGNQPSPRPLEREAPVLGRGWGRGPIPVDKRKYRYDVVRGRASPAVSFSATKVDRMDAVEAGDTLHRLHQIFGIDKAEEARIFAFDCALWFEHTVNGASLLQPGRGNLLVDGVQFDIEPIKTLLGNDQRRFFRAFADDIAETNRLILRSYDPYDAEAVEKVGQIQQVALARGLHRHPHLCHDSSDACLNLSMDERMAVLASKRLVIPSVINQVDVVHERVGNASGMSNYAAVAGARDNRVNPQ